MAHDASQSTISLKRLSRYSMIALMLWTAIVAGSLGGNSLPERRQSCPLARHTALAYFNKDLSFRLWGPLHGGVYVPIDARTPPPLYLQHIPERDITTPSGRRLTLMNPAYMADK